MRRMLNLASSPADENSLGARPGGEPAVAAPMVEFNAVSKAFGDHVVLNQISFAVNRGERVSLIGASGSGKSTILRLIMTLEQPSSGSLLVDGRALWEAQGNASVPSKDFAAIRRNVGMVFQSYNLFP